MQASEVTPPSAPVAEPIDWSTLALVLGALYLSTMLILMATACWCRNRDRGGPLAEVIIEEDTTQMRSSVPAGAAAPAQGIFTTRKVTRVRRAEGEEFDLSSIERSIKMGFVRKVYSILASQFALTVAIVMAIIYSAFEVSNGAPDPSRPTALGQTILENYWILMLMFIPLLFTICCLHSVKDSYPTNWFVLILFTVLGSLDLGVFCLIFYAGGYGSQILLAFGCVMHSPSHDLWDRLPCPCSCGALTHARSTCSGAA